MTTKAVATRETVASIIEKPAYKRRFEDILGKRAPQFISSLISVSNASHLRDADPPSVIAASMVAATLDLPINPNLGFAYIVPYQTADRKLAQFQMGYKGYIQLALRTGQYKTLNDAVIPHNALVSYNELTGDLEVDWSKADYTQPADGYAFFFRLNNGFEKTIFWTRDKVERHARRFSKSFTRKDGPWQEHFDTMALKTVIRAGLSKYGILSIELRDALIHDHGTQRDIDAEVSYLDNPGNDPEIKSPDFQSLPAVASAVVEGMAANEGPGPKKPSEPPQHTPRNDKERLAIALSDIDYKQTNFVAGLRSIMPDRIPSEAVSVHHLPDEIIAEVWKEGIDNVIELINAKAKAKTSRK